MDERKTMKSIITILLCASLLLEGCYSYSAITADDKGQLNIEPDTDIQIRQKDGTEFEVKGNHFVSVTTPSNFVYGEGTLVDGKSGNSVDFVGIVNPVASDTQSVRASGEWGARRIDRYRFYLNNGLVAQYNQGDFVSVDSAQGSGLWVCGKGEAFDNNKNGLRIPFENVKAIEKRSFSPGRTVLCLAGVAVGTTLLLSLTFLVIVATGNFKVGG
jgi:hypothetical protein